MTALGPDRPAPRTVTGALACFIISLLIGVEILAGPWDLPLQGLFTLLLVGFFIVQSARRRNWARWVLAIMTITTLVGLRAIYRLQLEADRLLAAATATQLILEMAACVLLFLPSSGRWFRRRPGKG